MLALSVVHQVATRVATEKISEQGCTGAEVPMAVLTLNDKGMIRECSQAAGTLLGCQPSKLLWQHVSRLLPQLAGTTLMKAGQINPHLRFLSRIGYHFDVIGLNGAHYASELFFSVAESLGRQHLRIIIRPAGE